MNIMGSGKKEDKFTKKKKPPKETRRRTFFGFTVQEEEDTYSRRKSVQRRAISERRGSKWVVKFQKLLKKATMDEVLSGWQRRVTSDNVPYYYEIATGRVQFDKPEALKTQAEKEADAAEWVWVPHPKNVWQPAKVKAREKNGEVIVKTMDSKTIKIPFIKIMKGKLTGGVSQKVPLWPLERSSLDRIEDDLVALPTLDEGMILHNLRLRYENNDIYTWVGSNRSVLISVNPFQDLPLYTEEHIKIQRLGANGGGTKPIPHVFGIANDALESLLYENKSQSILISGESGAGKTHATKQCLDFLAHVAGSDHLNHQAPGKDSRRSRRLQSNTQQRFLMTMMAASSGTNPDQKVEQKVLVANPVLEAFGNAKTVRNNNSSRFGKWISVYIDKHDKSICGAKITSFLLESSRVTIQSANERNYHIFYQLLATEDICENFNLQGGAESFHYVNQSGSITVDNVNDAEEFEEVVDALDQLGFEEEEQNWLFRTTCAVLHLGNIEFEHVKMDNNTKGCALEGEKSSTALQNAAELLEIDAEELERVLTKRTITVRGEKSVIPLKVVQAQNARDSFSKGIYARLFDWLVNRINQSFGEANGKFIGILDIFGFEVFEHNSFEQLCINYANEKLQQLFNTHTFGDEEELYELEKIQFKHVEFQDNQPVLDLIDKKPDGILNLLDDECVVPGGSDGRLMGRIEGVHRDNKNFKSLGSKSSKNMAVKRSDDEPMAFSINHFAGKVVYDLRGFMAKNTDNMFQDLYETCMKSDDDLTQNLFPMLEEHETVKAVSQCGKFRVQLQELMGILNKTESRYIRCIKPNAAQAPNDFNGRKCLDQLRASGVFGCVEIRKTGYPFRLHHEDFARRYRCINLNHTYKAHIDDEVRQFCREILEMSPHKFAGVQIGEMRVMYRVEDHKMLELLRDVALTTVIPKIQRVWRRGLGRILRRKLVAAEKKLRKAIDAGTDIGELEDAIDDVPEMLGEIGKIFRILPPSMSEAKELHAGLEQWETVETEMEAFEDISDKADLDRAKAEEVIRKADLLRDKEVPMTESQKELYDHIKELLLEETIEQVEEKAEEALESGSREQIETVSNEARAWARSNGTLDELKELNKRYKQLEQDAMRAVEMVDKETLFRVDKEAKELEYTDENIEKVEQLLQLDERSFVKLELECAKKWRDKKRQIHRELRLREFRLVDDFEIYQNFFTYEKLRGQTSGNMCTTATLSNLKKMKGLAKKTKLPNRLEQIANRRKNGQQQEEDDDDDDRRTVVKLDEDDNHEDLTPQEAVENDLRRQFGGGDAVSTTSASGETHYCHTKANLKTSLIMTRNKYHIQLALTNFKRIRVYMNDMKKTAPIPTRNLAGLEVLRLGLENEYLRNEIYVQLVQQLTRNPVMASVIAGVDLFCLCVSAFPPMDDTFEKYLTVWCRLHLPTDFYNTIVSLFHHHTLNEDKDDLHQRLLKLIQLEQRRLDDAAGITAESKDNKNKNKNNKKKMPKNDGSPNEQEDDDDDESGEFSDDNISDFDVAKSEHALEAFRRRFRRFMETGSRFSIRMPWDSDPWITCEEFNEQRNLIIPANIRVEDLCGLDEQEETFTVLSDRSDSLSSGSSHQQQQGQIAPLKAKLNAFGSKMQTSLRKVNSDETKDNIRKTMNRFASSFTDRASTLIKRKSNEN